MDTLSQILQLILCLSILVILHELGHFLPAKWFKTKVDKFYLFFDPWFSLVKKKIGETEYGIGWLPLGGYVKIAGMIDESMDKEQLKQPPQPWEYRSKKPWQKLIIILGGVTVNFFLSWLIYSAIFSYYGQQYVSLKEYQKNGLSFNQAALQAGFKEGDKLIRIDGKPVQNNFNNAVIDLLLSDSITVDRQGKSQIISLTDDKIKAIFNGNKKSLISPFVKDVKVDSLLPKGNAKKAGLLVGDQIVLLNNKPISSFTNLQNELVNFSDKKINIGVLRNNDTISVPIQVSNEGTLGFAVTKSNKQDYVVSNKYSFFEAIPKAYQHMMTMLNYNIKQFKLIIRPKTEAYKQVSGPLRMFQVFDANWDWHLFWSFTAMFSIWLAFINLLPIPGLDGGHAVFILIEMITGKQASEKTLEVAQTIGFVIIMSLMVITFGNDIWYWVQKFMQ
jgi:regulator of sigma E protease